MPNACAAAVTNLQAEQAILDVPLERCVGRAATTLSLPYPAGGGFSFLARGSEGAVWLARLQHVPRGRLGRTPKGDLQASAR